VVAQASACGRQCDAFPAQCPGFAQALTLFYDVPVPNAPVLGPILCDSCGVVAAPDHIRERMARLELSTRHRPFHIGLLLVCTAPPINPDDDLYAWERQSSSAESRPYIESLFACVGVSTEKTPAEQLADLQRRGVYFARLIECPMPEGVRPEELAAKFGSVLAKRINYSYKPRQIALLSPVADGLAEILISAGFGDRLVASGKGIQIPSATDSGAIAAVRAIFSKAISASEGG